MNLEEFLKLNCTTNEEIIWYHNKQLITPVRFIRSYKYIQQQLIIQVFPPLKPNTNVSPYNKNHRLHVLRQDVKQIKFQITRPPHQTKNQTEPTSTPSSWKGRTPCYPELGRWPKLSLRIANKHINLN